MERLSSIWAWLKKWWVAFAAGVFMLLGFALFSRRRQVGRLLDELTADRAKSEVKALGRIRDHMVKQDEVDTKAVQRLDDEIQRNKRSLVEAHEHAEGLSDDEVDSEFARLGY